MSTIIRFPLFFSGIEGNCKSDESYFFNKRYRYTVFCVSLLRLNEA